jgi:uncharacterized surface protein with fasciclin (FAS1) repeats
MQRRLLATLACGLLLAGPAAADDDHEPRYDRHQHERLLKCARTPLVHFNGNIVEAAIATPDLSTLVEAVVKADLVETLSGPGPFTVYAPVNAAFANLPDELAGPILADKQLLTAVLTYHVTPGKADPRRALIPSQVPTVQGHTVFIAFDRQGPQVNQSNVNCRGVRTKNGTVWLIDSVLLPQFR